MSRRSRAQDLPGGVRRRRVERVRRRRTAGTIRWAAVAGAAVVTAATALTGPSAPTDAVEPDRPCVTPQAPDAVPVAPAAPRAAGPGGPAAPGPHGAGGREDLPAGSGVTVAVIDTGVADHPRLGGVVPGADLVEPDSPDPLRDCDGHGTVVAGIIAARPSPGDPLVGVAPGAQVLSVRQSSGHFRTPGGDERHAGDLAGLAEAVDDAVSRGARVLNVSVVACTAPGRRADTEVLSAALERAEAAGAVVVAAAGNASQHCREGSAVHPASAPTVLAVGALADGHRLADYSLPAGDDALAAPGSVALGLSPDGTGLATGVVDQAGSPPRGFAGTSFAAPAVSGLAAALIAREPQLSPAAVRARLRAAAQPPHGALSASDALAARSRPPLSAPGRRPEGLDSSGAAAAAAGEGVGAAPTVARPGGRPHGHDTVAAPVVADDPARRRAAVVLTATGTLAVLAVPVCGALVGGPRRKPC